MRGQTDLASRLHVRSLANFPAPNHISETRFHLDATTALRSSSSYFSFFFRLKLRLKRSIHLACRCLAGIAASTGRKPPSKSADSVCVDRLMTVNGLFKVEAMCCTAVVFPVPVSPTNNIGSPRVMPTATRSRRIADGFVIAYGLAG